MNGAVHGIRGSKLPLKLRACVLTKTMRGKKKFFFKYSDLGINQHWGLSGPWGLTEASTTLFSSDPLLAPKGSRPSQLLQAPLDTSGGAAGSLFQSPKVTNTASGAGSHPQPPALSDTPKGDPHSPFLSSVMRRGQVWIASRELPGPCEHWGNEWLIILLRSEGKQDLMGRGFQEGWHTLLPAAREDGGCRVRGVKQLCSHEDLGTHQDALSLERSTTRTHKANEWKKYPF